MKVKQDLGKAVKDVLLDVLPKIQPIFVNADSNLTPPFGVYRIYNTQVSKTKDGYNENCSADIEITIGAPTYESLEGKSDDIIEAMMDFDTDIVNAEDVSLVTDDETFDIQRNIFVGKLIFNIQFINENN